MIAIEDIRSLTDFQRNTNAHLMQLKATGRLEVLTVNGNTELNLQDAAAYEETSDAIRGIQRRLDAMRAGKADAVLAASIFHFGTYTVGDVKRFLAERKIPVRLQI